MFCVAKTINLLSNKIVLNSPPSASLMTEVVITLALHCCESLHISHFRSMSFYIPWKHQKNSVFCFERFIKMEHWTLIRLCSYSSITKETIAPLAGKKKILLATYVSDIVLVFLLLTLHIILIFF